ncbi:hypothetical protein Tco_0170253 [Tanacetum coccineum]
MQNLDKELSFTNQFLAEKSQEDEPEKTNTEVEVQSMVTVLIHQDTSSVPLMTYPIIDLTVSQPASTMRIGELERCIVDLVEENQTLEERLDKQGNMMHQLQTQDLSRMIKEQIMEYMRTQEVDRKSMKCLDNDNLQIQAILEDVFMLEESNVEAQDLMSDDEYISSRHIPKVNLNQEWFKPISEEERHAIPEPAWSIPSSSLLVPINNWESVIASSYAPPPENSLLTDR